MNPDHTKESRKIQKESMVGKAKMSEEGRKRLSEYRTGRKHSEATLEKMRNKVVSEATRKKMRLARSARWRLNGGWIHSEETRKKMSESQKTSKLCIEHRRRLNTPTSHDND